MSAGLLTHLDSRDRSATRAIHLPPPSPLARRIAGRVAFWTGIEVETTRPGTGVD